MDNLIVQVEINVAVQPQAKDVTTPLCMIALKESCAKKDLAFATMNVLMPDCTAAFKMPMELNIFNTCAQAECNVAEKRAIHQYHTSKSKFDEVFLLI